MFARFAVTVLVTAIIAAATPALAQLEAERLRTEYLENPIGIDETAPRLSWIVTSAERGERQTAYRILVASSEEKLARNEADLWDSGRVRSDRTLHIAYGGEPLESRMDAHWKVRVWNADRAPSDWSGSASWSMGLLDHTDWAGIWIGHDVGRPATAEADDLHLPPSPYLRRAFEADKEVARATLYVTAGGAYDMYLNGDRVGDHVFGPGWTDYAKRIYYRTYDVTDQVTRGENAIGAILADGWYAGYLGPKTNQAERGRGYYNERPSLLAQLEVTYADGTTQTIATDRTWKGSEGPIREADIYMGQAYDARLEMPGWASPGFDDGEWTEAAWRAVPDGRVMAHPAEPVRTIEELTPRAITSPKDGVHIFDVGQNISGVVRLRVKGEAGDRVTLRFSEMLYDDGTLMTANLRGARATDTYILKGDPDGEVWTPQFTYHGFQYVEVTGLPGKPSPQTVTALRVNSDTSPAGQISVSDDRDVGRTKGLVNQLLANIKTSQYANFFDVPTDCPQRDERLGWTGDAQIYARSSAYIADVGAFFGKWMGDVRDAQLWHGAYPHYVPAPSHFYVPNEYSPGWMDAGVIVPFEMFTMYGDERIVDRHWDSMERFMTFQADKAGNDVLSDIDFGFGDWLATGEQPSRPFIAAAYYGYDARLMAKMAEATGRDARADHYRTLYEDIRTAFAEAYFNDDGTLKQETQTAYVMALDMGLVRADLEVAAADRLAAMVRENGSKLSTGFLGVKHLLPVLTAYGHEDLAYDLLLETDYPSWGYEIANGATSIWERWNSFTQGEGFLNQSMNSFNHYTYGSVAEWMFEDMGGIAPATPGFETIRIRPSMQDRVGTVTASYDSIRGPIKTTWTVSDEGPSLRVTIPANTVAEVYIPAEDADAVWEGEGPADEGRHIRHVREEGGDQVFLVGSGSYVFDAEAVADAN